MQQCIVHLIRNSFRYAGRQHRDAIVKALKPVYTAPSEAAAADRFAEFAQRGAAGIRRSSGCGRARGPSSCRSWSTRWRSDRVICTINAIESINARYRCAVNARGHFPNEAAAMKCPYLTARSLDPTGNGKARWVVSPPGTPSRSPSPAGSKEPLTRNRRAPHTVYLTDRTRPGRW